MTPHALLATPGLQPVLAALPQARLVGGCVRDMLAGSPVGDIDLATPDPPAAILRALGDAQLRAIPTGIAHGTITAISAGRPFEITTLRRDEETFGRHARVAWSSDFREDAARRDFTINAMSLAQDGTLHDYFGGVGDLRDGRIRFVGEAALRVREDFLRILRFFRFFARYGVSPADADAVAAIAAGLAGLATLSAERIAAELKRILAAPEPGDAVALMEELGVLRAVLPEGHDRAAFNALLARHAPADPLLRLAALSLATADELCDRLKLSNAERARLAAMRTGPVPVAALDERTHRRLLAEEPAETLLDRAWLAGTITPELAKRLLKTSRPLFPLEGRDALALGAAPGPQIGAALARTRAAWLESGCTLDRNALTRLLLQELSGPT